MITEILFLSVAQMRKIKPSAHAVVISILDRSEAHERPRLGGFRSVLTLDFEDTSEEAKLAHAGQWPDEPSDEEHARFCQGKGERVPTLSDARQIVDFIERHRASPEPLSLYVHCHGGVSRSAAVAEFASVLLWLPIGSTRSIERANPRLRRLLNKAAGRI
ncbi:hypothetical protein [Burkholderia cenocepacia]|uniref:hypothetical protein n=1 Tax=Burkholderia cenocepacia TaxID=95486 RepID=UPI000B0BFAEE|nr:hypothetical protein [Burkholderia cenocepacia]